MNCLNVVRNFSLQKVSIKTIVDSMKEWIRHGKDKLVAEEKREAAHFESRNEEYKFENFKPNLSTDDEKDL